MVSPFEKGGLGGFLRLHGNLGKLVRGKRLTEDTGFL
jgi:hypothetical protein